MNNPLKEAANLQFYKSKSGVRWIVLILCVIIAFGSIFYTSLLVNEIKEREESQMVLYAKTLEQVVGQVESLDLNIIHGEIINANNTIPVVHENLDGVLISKNVPEVENIESEEVRRKILLEEIEKMKEVYPPIPITYKDNIGQVYGYGNIYYRNSVLLTRLQYYPYVQLTVIALFALIAYAVKRNCTSVRNTFVLTHGMGRIF